MSKRIRLIIPEKINKEDIMTAVEFLLFDGARCEECPDGKSIYVVGLGVYHKDFVPKGWIIER
jgi:hypothetical protein